MEFSLKKTYNSLKILAGALQWRNQKFGLGVQLGVFCLKSSVKIRFSQIKGKNFFMSSA